MTDQFCNTCKSWKSPEGFYTGRKQCKDCTRARVRQNWDRKKGRAQKLMKLYCMTIEEYDAKLESQDGRCAICREVPEEGDNLYVDHDHRTGVVRGLLCNMCNLGLGKYKDDPAILRRAAEYLEANRVNSS